MVLAGTLAAQGHHVAVVDADPGRAFASWAEAIYEGPALAVRAEADEARLAAAIDELAAEADVVLLDTGGFGNRAAVLAITASDATLIPCSPSRADVEQAASMVRLVESAARAARRAIPARVVPSRVRQATAVTKHTLAEIDAGGLPRTAAVISDRVAVAEMTFSGRVPAAGEAGQEIAALVAELRHLGWLPPKRSP